MTKNQKVEYINKVNARFEEAKNHGRNGSNWWYPTPNTLAYNVKVYSYVDIDELRKKMTKRQNEYYNDNTLQDIHQEQENDQARYLQDEVEELAGVLSVSYAGRSGGWLEVEYSNPLEHLDEQGNGYNRDKDELATMYKEAKELEKQEQAVSEVITTRHKAYCLYVKSIEYLDDLLGVLSDDDEIGEVYKGKAQELLEKLK